MRRLKKKTVPCKNCGKPTRSKIRRASCKTCRQAQKASYAEGYKSRAADLRENRRAAMTEADREREREYMRAYVNAHREEVRANHRRYMRRETKRNASILREVEALCEDCGSVHSLDLRLRILRRCADLSPSEVRDAYPCLWGPPDDQDSYAARRFYLDRALLSGKQAEVAA